MTVPTATQPAQGSGFASSLLKLASGSALAQVLTVLTAPLIARLFLPAEFGTAALFVSLTGVIGAVVTLRYEYSIMLPPGDDEAANSMALSVVLVLLTSAVTMGLLALSQNKLLLLLHAPELSSYLWLAPPAVALFGISTTLNVWVTRMKQFGYLSLAQLAGVFFGVLLQISAGLAGYTSAAILIAAVLLSQIVQTIIVLARTCWQSWPLLANNIRPRRMLDALCRYKNFPKFSMGSTVLNNLSVHIPNFLLSAFFSPSVVGYYALGNRLLRMPANLIGTNVATVFFQHAAEARHEGKLTHSAQMLFHYLVNLIVFPTLILTIIGRDVFVIGLGSAWAEAGVYTQILSVWLLFWFISMPLGMILSVLEKQGVELRLMLLVLVTRVLSLAVGGFAGSARITLAIFSASGVLVYGYYCLVVLRYCSVSSRVFVEALEDNFLKFMPAGVILIALKYFQVNPLAIVISGCTILAAYYSNSIRTDPMMRGMVSSIWQRLRPARAL